MTVIEQEVLHQPVDYAICDPLLHLNGIGFTPEGFEYPILRDIEAAIYNLHQDRHIRGQVVALIGPSGIGKTTLFKIMAGLLAPTTGSVLLCRNPVIGLSIPRDDVNHFVMTEVGVGEVGVVTQNYYVFPHRTVLGNLVVAGKQAGLSNKDSTAKALGLLTEFGLTEHVKKFPAQLSGGQRQRVAICQQLMCSEHFLLMDEPFSGLDPLMKNKVCELILKVSSLHEHNTIVVVTHDISTAVRIADTIWVMGRDRNPDGSVIPGARIVEKFNLVDMGLAWRPDVQKDPLFHEFSQSLVDRLLVA